MARKHVVIGLLGTTLDGGHTAARWKRWRPSIAICQQAELRIDRFDLLMVGHTDRLAKQVIDDIAEVAPGVEVRPHVLAIADPWDLSVVSAGLGPLPPAHPPPTPPH